MRRGLWGKVAVAVAAGLALMSLPACDYEKQIYVERATLFPATTSRQAPIPIELRQYDVFEIPAKVPGILRVEFSSGVEYDQCTLNLDGSFLLDVKAIQGSNYYVEKPVPGMEAGRSADASLTCTKPVAFKMAFSDYFGVKVRDAGGRITARPLDVYFAKTAVGDVATGDLVVVTNLGSSFVYIPTLELTGSGSASFVIKGQNCRSGAIGAGKQCAILLQFKPTGVGAVEAALVITTKPTRTVDTVRLFGTGVPAPVPIVSISADRVAFGTVAVGNSESRRITVKNAGTAPLSLSQLHLEYDQSIIWLFLTSDGCGGRTLAPGETCDFVISFSPQLSGPQSALLRFTSNAAGSPHDLRITGDAVAPAPAPTPTPTPTTSCPYYDPHC